MSKQSTIFVRLKGIVIGSVMVYIGYFFSIALSVSNFIDRVLGENVLSAIVSTGVSLFFAVMILAGAYYGLKQFFTGEDIFEHIFSGTDKLTEEEKKQYLIKKSIKTAQEFNKVKNSKEGAPKRIIVLFVILLALLFGLKVSEYML